MGAASALLERMAGLAGAGPQRQEPSAHENLDTLVESVRRHMVRLLNARHGMSETAPDYGLPALADLLAGNTGYLRQVQEAIRTTIEKYEPRLRRVRVTHQTEQGGAQMLVFRIDAVLMTPDGEHRVWYETSLTPDGGLQVAG